MLINMVLPGAAGSAEEPFAFEYSGNYTDNRVDGVGTVRLNTSGTLTVTGSPITVTATIVGGGGGGCTSPSTTVAAGGGGGGNQTVEVTLEAGTYEIVIGIGGAAAYVVNGTAGTGGDTSAFNYTSTGGTGGKVTTSSATTGKGGTPNGGNGGRSTSSFNAAGGTPNGGAVVERSPQAGGDGYVELTFS